MDKLVALLFKCNSSIFDLATSDAGDDDLRAQGGRLSRGDPLSPCLDPVRFRFSNPVNILGTQSMLSPSML